MCDCQLSTKEKDVVQKNWLCSGLEQKHPTNPLWKENSRICVIIPQGMVAGKAGNIEREICWVHSNYSEFECSWHATTA